MIQGDPVYPTVFNIVVDELVRVVLMEVYRTQEAQYGLGWAAREHNKLLFVYNGLIAGHNPIWIQTTLTADVRTFDRVGLQKNLGKTEATVCIPGFIWGKQRVGAYKRRETGEVSTFIDWKETRVSCEYCKTTMSEFSLLHHMERAHRIVMPYIRGVEIGGGGPEIYVVSFPRVLKSVECPVYECLSMENNLGRLRENFMYLNWKAKIVILQEFPAPLPWCDHCGIHIPAVRLWRNNMNVIFNRSMEMCL